MRINRFRLYLQSWFTFTRRERNGILLLTLILFGIQLYMLTRYFLFPAKEIRPVSMEEKNAFNQVAEHTVNRKPTAIINAHLPSGVPGLPPAIDPNKTTPETWISFGLSAKQAAVVMNWKKKGGYFRSRDDVMNMKFIPAKVYRAISSRLVFNTINESPAQLQIEKNTSSDFKYHGAQKAPVDLNTADSVALNALPYIGTGRANAILRYRERLGGFFSVDQLPEIRIIPDSIVELIRNRITVSTKIYRKIDLNTFNPDSVYHPYLSRPLAKMIVNYRVQHGPFQSVEEVKTLPLVDEEIWRKLAPYLTINL